MNDTKTIRISIEHQEGYMAYCKGIDGYAAKPYPELTQEMTDWFAGWVAAKRDDQADQA
jgi:ribosome modulation factor